MPNGQYVWAAGMLRTRLILLVLWKKEQQDIRVGKGVKEMKGDMKVESLKRERKCFNPKDPTVIMQLSALPL